MPPGPSGGLGDPPYRLLTILQVAEILQTSPRTVRRFIKSGELQAIRIGRSVRVRPEALQSFIQGK